MPCVAWSQESLRTRNGGLNNVQSPDPIRVWLDALHDFGTLNKWTLQKRLHVQKTNTGMRAKVPTGIEYDTILHSRPPLFCLFQQTSSVSDFLVRCEPNACGGFIRSCFSRDFWAHRSSTLTIWICMNRTLSAGPQDTKRKNVNSTYLSCGGEPELGWLTVGPISNGRTSNRYQLRR